MSDTDDTDVLLLIPPDFFLVRSSDSSCAEASTARTVVARPPAARRALAALHASLGSLEHRVASLELSHHSSLFSERALDSSSELHSVEKRSYTFPRRRRRKTYSRRNRKYRDSSLTSNRTSSFAEELVPALPLSVSNSLSISEGVASIFKHADRHLHNYFAMDSEISSVTSSPSKKTDKFLLSEIDDFLNKVESYEGPHSKFNALDHAENMGDYNSQNQENRITLPSGRTVPQEFLDKYIYLVKNPQPSDQVAAGQPRKTDAPENTAPTSSSATTSQNIGPSQPGFRNSVRKLNFNERDLQTTSTPNAKRLTRMNSAPNMEPFPPSNNKMYEKEYRGFEHYKFPSLSNCDTISNISSHPSPQKNDVRLRRDPGRGLKSTEYLKCSDSKYTNSVDTDLLSLSELWSEQDGLKNDNAKLEEERLKREHCEAVIQDLQRKLLAQQEKLAVAVRVDRAKDNAIARLRDAWSRVTGGAEAADGRHRTVLQKMNKEMEQLRRNAEESQKKTQHFENEMYKTLDLAHDYQEKCRAAEQEKRQLEEQVEKMTAEASQLVEKKEQEIVSLRDNYESVLRLNKQLTDCVKNSEDSLDKEKASHAETRSELSSAHKLTQGFQEELTLVQQERDLIKEKVKEERSRNLILEKQIGEVQGRLADAQKKESSLDAEVKSLRKHLELQKNELKSYYQKQLEEAVLSKLREFQLQLDAAEREVEREARAREGQLVDCHNKRIHRLEEQHALEVGVLEEKQREEVKLYRLQLAQSAETIAALQNKVESYKQRRGQIASQLHDVMESQWRQALDILTSADISGQRQHAAFAPRDSGLPAGVRRGAGDAAALEPSLADISAGRYNTDGLSDTEIQHYVKMLLSKPPEQTGGGGGGGGLAEGARVKCEPEEPTSDRAARRALNGTKPPWKA